MKENKKQTFTREEVIELLIRFSDEVYEECGYNKKTIKFIQENMNDYGILIAKIKGKDITNR